jgi:hypothetical protein
VDRFLGKNYEECLKEVKENGYGWGGFPDEYKTEELYLAAVEQTGNTLGFLPKKVRTPKICLAAVKKYGYAICYVSEEKMTAEMFWTAIQNEQIDHLPSFYRKADYKWVPTKCNQLSPFRLAAEYVKVPLEFRIKGMRDMSLED